MMVKLCATRQTRHLPAVRGLAVAATPFPFLECCRAYSAGPSLIEGVKCFFRFGRGVFFLPSQKSRAQEPENAPWIGTTLEGPGPPVRQHFVVQTCAITTHSTFPRRQFHAKESRQTPASQFSVSLSILPLPHSLNHSPTLAKSCLTE
mgnify:CR=1 FL=1